jgi:hypothetical protein
MSFRQSPSEAAPIVKRIIASLVVVCACAATSAMPRETSASCYECGVINSVRELQQERAEARNLERLPPVGPVFGFTFGDNGPAKGFVGAIGNQEMRQRLTEISYEVIVRFNDGRYGVVETRDGADLRVGDPVKVVRNQIQLDI